MVVAGLSLDVASIYNVLQEEYGKQLHLIQNNESFGYNMLDTAQGINFSGKRVVEAVSASYVASSGYYGQAPPAMPTPGNFTAALTYIQQCVSLFNLRTDWTAIAKTTRNAFVNAWSVAFDTLAEHRKLEKERITFGRGNAILNRIDSTDVVAGGFGIDITATSPLTFEVHIWDTPAFRVGMQIQAWYLASGPAAATASNWYQFDKRDTPTQGFYTIASVVPTPASNITTITCAENSPGLNSPADGDYVTVAGAVVQDAFTQASTTYNAGNEPMGLQGIISQDNAWLQHNVASDTLTAGTFQGIDTSTNGYWRSPKVTASGYLTKDLLASLAVNQNVFGTSAASSFLGFFAHPAQIQKYAASLEGAERVMVMGNETPQLPSGRTSILPREGMGPFIQWSGKPIMDSRFMDPRDCYAFNKNGAKKYILQEPRFESRHQDFQGRPAWQMDGMEIDNIGTTDRSCCGVITGMTIPSAS